MIITLSINDYFVEFDFDGYHLRLLCEQINYPLTEESAHKQLAKLYFGKEEITVLDPGPAMDSHIDAITSAEGKIKQIVVTHTHPDHSPGVRLLQERLDVRAYGMVTET